MKCTLRLIENKVIVLEIQSESDVESIALNAWAEKDAEHSEDAVILIKHDVVGASVFCDHGRNGLCPVCDATQTPPIG